MMKPALFNRGTRQGLWNAMTASIDRFESSLHLLACFHFSASMGVNSRDKARSHSLDCFHFSASMGVNSRDKARSHSLDCFQGSGSMGVNSRDESRSPEGPEDAQSDDCLNDDGVCRPHGKDHCSSVDALPASCLRFTKFLAFFPLFFLGTLFRFQERPLLEKKTESARCSQETPVCATDSSLRFRKFLSAWRPPCFAIPFSLVSGAAVSEQEN